MKRNDYRPARLGILLISVTLLILALAAAGRLGHGIETAATPLSSPSSDTTRSGTPKTDAAKDNSRLAAFAQQHGLRPDDWPSDLLDLLARNPDTESFVLQYPLKKDTSFPIDLSIYQACTEVPLLLQWDERWGYTWYGDNLMGLTGCGPTCLSMVCIYLLGRTDLSPRAIADFAESRGYYAPGKGSTWTLFSEGGRQLGLNIYEIPLVKSRMISELSAGNPIICAMGPGDFTTAGHFIVLTDYINGQFKLNDPNSPTRSARLWDYSELEHQIRNLWVCEP